MTSGRSRARRVDAGMVSAELAVALPAVIFVLLMALAGLRVGVDQIRCTDAARVAARAAARGDPVPTVQQAGVRAAPPGSSVTVRMSGDLVQVTVTSPVRGPFGWIAGARRAALDRCGDAGVVAVKARTENGSGTVLMVAVIVVILLVLGGGLALVSAVQASLRARTAADMAALAADSALLRRTGDPCSVARRVAGAGGARLDACLPGGDTVTVSVVVQTAATARLHLGGARARSRAGPSPALRVRGVP